jgi:hypothetical protein
MFFLYLYLDKFPPTFHPISFILVCLVHTRLGGASMKFRILEIAIE